MLLQKRIAWLFMLSGLSCGLSGCSDDWFARQLAPSASVNETTMEVFRGVLESGVASTEAASQSLGDPVGWAALFGKFTLAGAAPPNPALRVDKDVEVCAPGGKTVFDEAVVVGPDGGLANVLVFISSPIPPDNSAWIHESYASLREAEVIFDQKACVFLTRVGSMWSTQTLKILNSDPVGHNTNLASKRGAKAQDTLIPAGGSALYQPGAASPTPFPVSCAIHPWMKASMMVCDHPYFAVTKDDGSFEIVNVPAGVKLEFRVWHEKAGFVQPATVTGADSKWSKGRFQLQLADGDRHEMNAVIDVSSL